MHTAPFRRIILFVLGITLAISQAALAQTQTKKPAPAKTKAHPKKATPAKQKPGAGVEDGIFWEVSGNGLSKPSYLFGTMHVVNSSFLDRYPVIGQKLNNADMMVGEAVIDSSELMALAMYMISMDTTLDKLLTPAEFKTASALFEKYSGQPATVANMMKPVAIEALIAEGVFKKMEPELTKGMAMDMYFQQEAKKKGKPVKGLETMLSQAKLLFTAPLKQQAASLKKLLADTNKIRSEAGKMMKCYTAGDNNCLYSMMDEYEDMENFSDDLLKNRNNNWMTQLPNMMAGNSLFVAVGAMHMLGPDGLVLQLRKQGYTVKPVALK